MSTTLSCFAYLFEKGRHLEQLGFFAQACRVYQKLLDLEPESAKLVQETRTRLGRCQLSWGQSAEAQETLGYVLEEEPSNASAHNLLALSIDTEEDGDPDQAAEASEQAVQFDPKNADYLLDWAKRLQTRGDKTEALAMLRRALKAGEDNPAIVGQVAQGMRELGQANEAKQVLLTARFRNGHDRRFLSLWSDHQFQLACRTQRVPVGADGDGTEILPFTGIPRTAAV